MPRRLTIATAVLFALLGTNCAFRPIFHPPTERSGDSAHNSGEHDASITGQTDDDEDSANPSANLTGRIAATPAVDGSPGSDAGYAEFPGDACAHDGGVTDGRVKDDGPDPDAAAPYVPTAGSAGITYFSPK